MSTSYERHPLFKVGTTFKPLGKNQQVHTVTDILTTRNLAGELVQIRYVSTHAFCGQVVTNRDVVEPTISRGLINEA
jgi:hypothetical protein